MSYGLYANTYSPDATLAGPIVQVLRGRLDNFKLPTQIEKGVPIYYVKNRRTGKAQFLHKDPKTAPPSGATVDANYNVIVEVIPAEHVTLHVSDTFASIPVVVSGRTTYAKKLTSARPQYLQAGSILAVPGSSSKLRLTHEETIGAHPGDMDVFVEELASPRATGFK